MGSEIDKFIFMLAAAPLSVSEWLLDPYRPLAPSETERPKVAKTG